jgi:hypothetical protein
MASITCCNLTPHPARMVYGVRFAVRIRSTVRVPTRPTWPTSLSGPAPSLRGIHDVQASNQTASPQTCDDGPLAIAEPRPGSDADGTGPEGGDVTEEDWLTATDPVSMLKHFPPDSPDRKFRLFAVACCRCCWPPLEDERSRKAIEAAEQFADRGTKSWVKLRPLEAEAWRAAGTYLTRDLPDLHEAAIAAALSIQTTGRKWTPWWAAHQTSWSPLSRPDRPSELTAILHKNQTAFARDIFGNPFRPVAADPSWRTPIVTALADAIYADRAFDRMPVLADALEESGCSDEQVLTHCRGDGPHVRGCWVVDLVLGKK